MNLLLLLLLALLSVCHARQEVSLKGVGSIESNELRRALAEAFRDGLPTDLEYSKETIETFREAAKGSSKVSSDTASYVDQTYTDMDAMWLILGGALVFIMQPGFALLEAGSVRVKNTKNILFKNVCDACVGAIGFWSVGYAFAYADDGGNKFIGTKQGFFMSGEMYGMDGEEGYNGVAYSSWFFQFAFAATAATIVSGAVAERIAFPAYLIGTTCITVFIYPVVVHWGWSSYGWASAFSGDALLKDDGSSGLLFDMGVLDFAGCAIVHMVGGISALTAVILTGPRIGRFDADGKPRSLPQQSPVLQILGTFILWFGWFGFNCVSTLTLRGAAGVAGKVAVMTVISPAFACMTCILSGKFILKQDLSCGLALNGILAGLVGITSACSTVEPWAAAVIGILAGFFYIFASAMMLKMHLDDVVDAVPVHCVCGAWGALAPAFFASQRNYGQAYGVDIAPGLFYGGGAKQLAANVCFILACFGWVGGLTGIIWLLLKKTLGIRVSPQVEAIGMDVSKHGGHAFVEKEGDVCQMILWQKLGSNKVHPA